MNFYLFLAIFLVIDVLLVLYVLYRRSAKKFSQQDLDFFAKEWRKILMNGDGKHSIMDADKLLNVVLKKKGFEGSVGEQLKKAQNFFSNINDVWYAHKLRNNIAHELDVHLSPADKQKALRCFEKALKDLGAL